MAGKSAKRSQGFSPKKKATFIALLAAKAEAKTDAAAAWAGAMIASYLMNTRYPLEDRK